MSLLNSFLRFLKPEELLRLKRMPLTTKEQALFELQLNNLNNLEYSKPFAMKVLGMSSSHYDKLNTVVMKKTYSELAGKNELDQLVFLSKRSLYHHLFHEIRLQRKQIEKAKIGGAEKEAYLYVFFNLSLNVPAKFYEPDFSNDLVKSYLRLVKDDLPAKEMEARVKILFAEMNQLMHKLPDAELVRKIFAELRTIEKKYQTVKNKEIRTVLYRVFVIYHSYLDANIEKRNLYLKKISELYGGFEKLPSFEQALTTLHRAEMLFEKNKFNDAYWLYRNTLDKYSEDIKNQFHHFSRIAQIAMIVGDYAFAESFIENYFGIYIANKHLTHGIVGSILFGQLYLLTGNVDLAFKYISLGRSLNSIQIYFKHEVSLRLLENLYFAMAGDFSFSVQLAQKNIRYLLAQKLNEEEAKYVRFLNIIRETARQQTTKIQKPNAKIVEWLEDFRNGVDQLWGLLIQKYMNKLQ